MRTGLDTDLVLGQGRTGRGQTTLRGGFNDIIL